MSRTKIPDLLVHNLREVEQNAICFDQLCKVFRSVFKQRIYFSVWGFLLDLSDKESESYKNSKEQLDRIICCSVAGIAASWIAGLHESYRRGEFDLTRHLLPSNLELRKVFFRELEFDHSILEADVCIMMEDVQKKLFENVSEILLPQKLRIVKGLKGFLIEEVK